MRGRYVETECAACHGEPAHDPTDPILGVVCRRCGDTGVTTYWHEGPIYPEYTSILLPSGTEVSLWMGVLTVDVQRETRHWVASYGIGWGLDGITQYDHAKSPANRNSSAVMSEVGIR